jgi:two-component system, chemotaxis family, CheB/CheR fusion protein
MNSSEKLFPVVGIGASAGRLEAISELLTELPAKTGMAFLLVQHLAPHQESFLTDIVAGKTDIAVKTATDGGLIEPDHFYVIPPNTTLTIDDAVLRLASREQAERPHKPVNILFRSLAEEHGHRAVAVVLSGTDSDGAQGLEEVKAAGGMTYGARARVGQVRWYATECDRHRLCRLCSNTQGTWPGVGANRTPSIPYFARAGR